jgi:hypothetical protein
MTRLSGPEADWPGQLVWVRIGSMDHRAVRQAREVLQQVCSMPGASLVVDVASTDDQHQLTVFALLTEAARVVALHGGSVTVLNPRGGLAASLVTSDVRVIRYGPPPQRAPGTLLIDVGAALPARGGR